MKELNFDELENLEGGSDFGDFCAGFGVGLAVLSLANSWNPGGWVGLGVAGACFLA